MPSSLACLGEEEHYRSIRYFGSAWLSIFFSPQLPAPFRSKTRIELGRRRCIAGSANCAGRRPTANRFVPGAVALKSRRRFKCAARHHQFSATSGTIFASRKLSFVDLLGATRLFVNTSKGL